MNVVTRGFGKTADGTTSVITRGYSSILTEVVEAARRIVRLGRSSALRKLEERQKNVTIFAKLIRVNDKKANVDIAGSTTVDLNITTRVVVKLTEGASLLTRKAWDAIKITVRRIR